MLAFLTLPTAGARRRAPAKRETTWVKIVIVAGLKLFSRRTSFGRKEEGVRWEMWRCEPGSVKAGAHTILSVSP